MSFSSVSVSISIIADSGIPNTSADLARRAWRHGGYEMGGASGLLLRGGVLRCRRLLGHVLRREQERLDRRNQLRHPPRDLARRAAGRSRSPPSAGRRFVEKLQWASVVELMHLFTLRLSEPYMSHYPSFLTSRMHVAKTLASSWRDTYATEVVNHFSRFFSCSTFGAQILHYLFSEYTSCQTVGCQGEGWRRRGMVRGVGYFCMTCWIKYEKYNGKWGKFGRAVMRRPSVRARLLRIEIPENWGEP